MRSIKFALGITVTGCLLCACAILASHNRSDQVVTENQNVYRSAYNTSTFADFHLSSDEFVKFETGDEILLDEGGYKVYDIFKRPERVSVWFDTDNSLVVSDFTLIIGFYDEEKNLIDTSVVNEELIVPQFYEEIKFHYNEDAAYVKVEELSGSIVSPTKYVFANLNNPRHLGNSIQNSFINLKVNRVSNNCVRIAGSLAGNYNAVVVVQDNQGIVLNAITIGTKKFDFKKFVDYGPYCYSVIVTEF